MEREGTHAREADLLVEGGLVVTMDDERRVLEPGSVAIAGDTIVAVGPTGEVGRRVRAREVIDARHHIVLPGLVNAHVHCGDLLFRGLIEDLPLEPWLERLWRVEGRFVTRENVTLAVRVALAEMVRAGTTTALDMFFFAEAAAEAAAAAGFRLLTGPVLLEPDNPEGRSPEGQLSAARDFLERWSDHGLVVPCVQPHNALTVAPECLRAARELAHEFGVLLHTHCSETRAEVEETRRRFERRPVEHLESLGVLEGPTVLAHCVHLTEEDVEILSRRGVAAVHNPLSNLKLGSGIAPLPRLDAAGVPVLLGTDGPVSSNDLDLWTAMRFAALLQRGVHCDATLTPARWVVEMVTCRAARALGLDDRIGSLEPGKRADLVLVDARAAHLTPMYDVYAHLVFAVGRDDVRTVLVDGRPLLRDRRLLAIDEEASAEAVRSLAREIETFAAEGTIS